MNFKDEMMKNYKEKEATQLFRDMQQRGEPIPNEYVEMAVNQVKNEIEKKNNNGEVKYLVEKGMFGKEKRKFPRIFSGIKFQFHYSEKFEVAPKKELEYDGTIYHDKSYGISSIPDIKDFINKVESELGKDGVFWYGAYDEYSKISFKRKRKAFEDLEKEFVKVAGRYNDEYCVSFYMTFCLKLY